MRSKRIDLIKKYIYENKMVTLDQICKEFGISKSTMRRDLNEILKDTYVKKVYGGLKVLPKREQSTFEARNIANSEAKMRIAAVASNLVEDGDVIFIDSGTTTLHMIDYIKDKKNITVITNNFELIQCSIPYEGVNIISLPGTFDRRTLSFTGSSALQEIHNYNINKAFMATTGFSTTCGVTNSFPMESNLKQIVVQHCRKVYLLADSSKFDFAALITYCDLSSIDILITDINPTKEIQIFMQEHDNKIIVAE